MAKAETPADRSALRKLVTIGCLLVVGALFVGVARQSWAASTEDQDAVNLEADGAAMMHPMTTLLTELVTAQTAAVQGEAVDRDAVQAALDGLAAPDAEYGNQLETTARLADLRDQVEAAVTSGVTGSAAYPIWSAIVDLSIDLIHVIGDTSQLVHDPDLDSYYLMDAAIVRLPRAIVYAGRAADIVVLAGGVELTGEDLVQAAVARSNVSDEAEQVLTGLTESVDVTQRAELGSNIAPRLDAFRSAADAFAPPTMLQELATEVNAPIIADNASRVLASAASLSHLLISELQALLQARTDRIDGQRRVTVASSAVAGVLALAMVWLVLARRRSQPAGSETPPAPTPPAPAPARHSIADLTRMGPPRARAESGGHAR